MRLGEERIEPGEAEAIAALVKSNLPTVWTEGETGKRGQHAKHHGLVEGEFLVHEHLPEGFAQGIFQPGARYACLVRFSNGSRGDDREADARGMAIKLLEVPGDKLMPGGGDGREQDFILVDFPTYFTATRDQYAAFNRYALPVLALRGNGVSPARLLRAAWGAVMLLARHRDLSRRARRFAGRHAGSVLGLTFHSTTPYLLGDGRAVKYKAIGRGPDRPPADHPGALREALWAELGKEPVRFDFGVVVQTDPLAHPVEDPTVEWEAAGADFVELAALVLPQQENTPDKDARAETLNFLPWNSLAEHRPLGFINRARREVYRAMSRLRHRKTRT
ncbi:hypothetical protein [Marinovum sp.]|uniref:hypothetical protein n=1 Tax=Marinovum sp. TaxID=2024839 RepID=UPI003A8CF737